MKERMLYENGSAYVLLERTGRSESFLVLVLVGASPVIKATIGVGVPRAWELAKSACDSWRTGPLVRLAET